MADVEGLSKKLLGLIDKSGADQGEVFVQTRNGIQMEVRDQDIERLRNKETAGVGLRLIVDKKIAFVHSSDIRDSSLERAVEEGVELAKTAAPDESNSLVQPSDTTAEVDTYDETLQDISLERKLSVLKDIETLSFACDPSISKIQSLSYGDSVNETVVANTNGVFRHKRETYFSLDLSVVAERDGDVETGSEWVESTFFEDLDPPSKIASKACRKAISLLGGRAVPTQNVPVIFDRDVGFAFLIHIFALINGENIATGISMLRERLGDTIGSSLVTIVDDPTIERGIGSREFDDEGTPSTRTLVVDKGILRSFLFDERTARKSGFRSTGNAKREDFTTLPSVGYSNLYVERGTSSPEKIVESTAKGLWLVSLAGWWVGINPSTGDFSSGAKGLWVEDGKIAYPVRNVTIASNVLDMLAGVDSVGNDLYFRHESNSPTFRIGAMKVGGL